MALEPMTAEGLSCSDGLYREQSNGEVKDMKNL